ncbi:hypothetical protein F2Q70_00011488 [Brassica cretica]|uniref:Uncharacterized protein n=1 Tax=Brassica cretica TaxID=69181 RepID=A0A8S9LXN1_BRACR|nr:hypothetical protein F2Q70_00011488 [Brassica cretica]
MSSVDRRQVSSVDRRQVSSVDRSRVSSVDRRRVNSVNRSTSGTCPAVLEATRKLNRHSHQILQVWSVQSAKNRASHLSTTTPICRSFRSTTVDPDTSPIDRYSLTTVERRHSSSIDRHRPSDIDRYSIPDIDRH